MEEIRQNGKTILSAPEHLKMIFNNLIGKNLSGKEYKDYINFVAIPGGFTPGVIEFYRDGVLVESGEIK